MEIAVLSDIHGNYVALESCIEYASDRGIREFIFLGDYLGELAYPQKTMNILYDLQEKYQCHFIKGNKEDYWLYHENWCGAQWKEKDSTTGALYYTYQKLTERDMQFYGSLSHVMEFYKEGMPAITLCHGSPNKANEKLMPNQERTFEIMASDSNTYILCGHTHMQSEIEYAGKKVWNVGAVGVPLYSGGKTQFMILRAKADVWEHEFVSMEYDVERTLADLEAEGLYEKAPCWSRVTEKLLRTGEVPHGAVLARAMTLCKEEMGVCNWPEIPEKYWEQAVAEML